MSDEDGLRFSLDVADERIADLREALKELAESTRIFLAGRGKGLAASPRLAEALVAADRILDRQI